MNTGLFKNKYRINSIRLPGYDYRQNGYYFVTICAFQRQSFFGRIDNGLMILNGIGCIVARELLQTPAIRPSVRLDAWMIMPNHIHFILAIDYEYPPIVDLVATMTPMTDVLFGKTPTAGTSMVGTPTVGMPVVEMPVVSTPVVEMPVVEMPVVSTPVVETPVVGTPTVGMPVVETPTVGMPVVGTPIVETPTVGTPIISTPIVEMPIVGTPIVETPCQGVSTENAENADNTNNTDNADNTDNTNNTDNADNTDNAVNTKNTINMENTKNAKNAGNINIKNDELLPIKNLDVNKNNGGFNNQKLSNQKPRGGYRPQWQSGSLGAIINQFKRQCTKLIRQNINPDFAWQSRFYDHIIRNEKSLNRIRQYIINNPGHWPKDRFFNINN